jgi:hypothetical protein
VSVIESICILDGDKLIHFLRQSEMSPVGFAMNATEQLVLGIVLIDPGDDAL